MPEAMHQGQGCLSGLQVVDLSTNLASAYTTLLFADYGAEVVQIERPGGSPVRSLVGWPFFLRGKKSIVLDLKDPADAAAARQLAEGSDVVVEAFGAGRAATFGLGYEALRAVNPGLVYTSITGFGHDGASSHLQCYDAVVMAKTGSMYGNVAPNRPGEPVMLESPSATIAAALLAQQGALLALHERASSGFGQRVDATMIQGMLAQDPWNHVIKTLTDRYPDAFTPMAVPTRERRVPTSWLLFGLLNGYSRDGRWMQFAHATPRQFDAFVRALGMAELRADPAWADAPDSPDDERRDAWWSRMLEGVRSRTTQEWQEVFDAEEHVFAEIYRRGTELFDHPQIAHEGQAVTTVDPELGAVRQMGPLVKMSATPGDATRPAPRVDEHRAELLARARPAVAPVAGTPSRSRPLEGVTIVDLGTFYAGPFGSTMLADQGATVIKIEALDGDPIRFQTSMPEVSGVRVTQGKKSVAVDAFRPEGREIVVELIRGADIVLHTYRGGVAERMGLDAERMRALNPNLVYHHGVGYGVSGPYSRRPAFAPTIGAGSGYAQRCGGGEPEGVDLSLDEIKTASTAVGGAPAANPDALSALGVAVGVMLGLVARDRGAGGQITMTSMLATMGHVLSDELIEYEGAPAAPRVDPDKLGYSATYRLYRASDDWVVLCAPGEHGWARLAGALELDHDDRFATAAGRGQHDAELAALLAERLAERPASDWEEELSKAGVGCAVVAPMAGGFGTGLFEPGGVCDQLGMLSTVGHPIFEELRRSRQLVTLSRGEASLGEGSTIGQHTDEVLRDLLGYDADRIAALRSSGVIGP